MNEPNTDSVIRMLAFSRLDELSSQHGDVLPYRELSRGISFEGRRVPLIGPQGIFKPRLLDLPLSIMTSPNSSYNDSFTENGLLRYSYRGEDPLHRDNVGLRTAMQKGVALIYFHGLIKGKYLAAWPVFVVADSPEQLKFTVAVDDMEKVNLSDMISIEESAEDRRRYITGKVKIRLHQKLFREKVLSAYREQCALCRLQHVELLDAAHIIPDSDVAGEPRISNGLSLCKLHHAAFDNGIMGIRPDYVVEIRLDILDEIDGPMLRHGLQEMHGNKIWVPRNSSHKPNKDALEERYVSFKAA